MHKQAILERIRKLTHPLSPISINHHTHLEPLEGIKCVALDFYGTMFISAVGEIGIDEEKEENSARFFADALKESGFTVRGKQAGKRGAHLFEETVASHVETAKKEGVDIPEPDIIAVWQDILDSLHQEHLIEGEITTEKAQVMGIEFELRINDIWPVPDLKTTLNGFQEKGLELGIISNSQYYTPLTFEALLGESPQAFGFDPELLIWSYKAGRKKPSTAFYQLFIDAALKKNIQPEEVLYVGNDIHKDIQPAKQVGLKTALYVGDDRSIRHEAHHLEQEEFFADVIIDDLPQLLECL